jgi:hypothetical protein
MPESLCQLKERKMDNPAGGEAWRFRRFTDLEFGVVISGDGNTALAILTPGEEASGIASRALARLT